MPTVATPRGKTIDVAMKAESVYGTPPAGDWTKTFIYSHSLKETKPFQDDKLLGLPRTNDRDATAPIDGLPATAGDILVPLDFNHIGLWLEAVFGAATISGSGDPYTHVFKSGAEVIPSRAIEVAVKNVNGSTVYMAYTGLYANMLKLDLGRAAGEQQLTVSMVGRAEIKNGSSDAGTPASEWAREPGLKVLGVFKVAGSAFADIIGVSGTYDSKLKAKDDVGDTTGYPIGYEFDDDATFTGTINLRLRSGMTLYDDAVAGSAFTGEMLFNKTSNRSLSILANAMRLEKPGVPIAGPGGIQQTFNFRCEQSVSAEMLTVTLKSSVATYNTL